MAKNIKPRTKRRSVRMLLPADLRRIACHESGHALVFSIVEPNIPIRAIDIRGNAHKLGGVFPERRAHKTMSRQDMLNQICIWYGGRAAEEIGLFDVSDTAECDLVYATEHAERMVRVLGMSDKFPPKSHDPKGRYSQMTVRLIDEAVNEILEQQYDRALRILEPNRDLLLEMTHYLERHRLLTGKPLELFLLRTVHAAPEKKESETAEEGEGDDEQQGA